MRKKYKKNPSTLLKTKVQSLESELKSNMSIEKGVYESELINSFGPHNNTRIYKYINNLTGRNCIPPTVQYGSSYASSDVDKASLFNSYFHSVFTQSNFCIPPVSELPLPAQSCDDFVISEADVFQALSNLDPNKAMGCDSISPRVLKHCALALTTPFYHLFSLSISQCYIPVEWRTHLIVPIFKSGARSMVNNYRPISLLCSISKVFESLVYKHLVGHISNSLSPNQFGFRKGLSTLHQLLTFLNNIYHSFDINVQTDVIYLDFKKAFDRVAHDELLFKLWSHGITGNIWWWLKAYLTGRLQCVSINNVSSSLLPVVSGVPQGSILGPLLFLVFINDLPTVPISSKMLLFADDTKCFHSLCSPLDCKLLQNDLHILSMWSHKWNLLFNEDKCVVMRFLNSSDTVFSNFSYSIYDKLLSCRKSHRDLGILLTSDLNWSAHYGLLLTNAYKTLGLLRRTFSDVRCVRAKKILYLSLVRSKLQHCSPLWRPMLIKDIISLECVQR